VSRGEGGTGQLVDPFGGRPPTAQPTVQVSLSDQPSGREYLAKIGAVIGCGARCSQRLEGEGLIAEQETHVRSPIYPASLRWRNDVI
jgi:hypothetical protein